MKRVALTADLQLQPQARYSTLSAEGVTTRLHDFIRCFNWIVDTAVGDGCDTLFLLGDIFDSRTVIDVSVIDLSCRAFDAARKRLDIHVLVGNHDAYLRSSGINSTQMLRGFATVHERVSSVGPFVLVPWTDSRDDYEASLKRADKAWSQGSPVYLLSHGMFGNAVPMAKGMPIEWLQGAAWSGVFLGDVHDPVVLQKKPVIRYVGSPLQIHFGDAGRTRGFVILDTKTAEHRYVENTVSPRFHLIANQADFDTARNHDFFRVSPNSGANVTKLVETAKKFSNWVTTDAVDAPESSARIVAANCLNDEQLLRAYCEFSRVPDADRIVASGLRLLREARSS